MHAKMATENILKLLSGPYRMVCNAPWPRVEAGLHAMLATVEDHATQRQSAGAASCQSGNGQLEYWAKSQTIRHGASQIIKENSSQGEFRTCRLTCRQVGKEQSLVCRTRKRKQKA